MAFPYTSSCLTIYHASGETAFWYVPLPVLPYHDLEPSGFVTIKKARLSSPLNSSLNSILLLLLYSVSYIQSLPLLGSSRWPSKLVIIIKIYAVYIAVYIPSGRYPGYGRNAVDAPSLSGYPCFCPAGVGKVNDRCHIFYARRYRDRHRVGGAPGGGNLQFAFRVGKILGYRTDGTYYK